MNVRIVLVPLVAIVFASATAHADPATAKRADRLFKEGSEALAQARYDEACPKLDESNRLEPALGTEYNFAICLELTHRTATARRLYAHVAEQAGKAGKPGLVKEAKDRATKLDAVVPRLIVRVPLNIKTETVRLDGALLERDSVGTVWELDPGRHAMTITAEGQEPFEKTIEAREGRTLEVSATFAPSKGPTPAQATAPAPATGPSEGATHGTFPWKWVGLGAAGVGVVGLAVGGIFGLGAKSARDDSGCRDDGRCPSEAAASRLRDAKSSADLSTVLVIAGSALTAGGLVVFFVAPASETSKAGAARPAPVVASVSITGTGMAINGSW